jgi:radical SAM protein with 4Fe4S-binding SPASM domain
VSILSDFKQRSSEAFVPTQLTVELTYRCNERCSHCYLATYDDRADGRPPLALAEWKRILDEFADAGTLSLILIGGEAMMHPQFWGVAEHAADRCFAVSLITNGLLIDEEAAGRMAGLGFHNVTVSLYSLDPAIHDRMTRRAGSHARALGAIGRLRESGVGIGVNCLLTRDNIEGWKALDDWGRSLGIEARFDPMITAKSDASLAPTTLRATPEQLRRYYLELRALGRGPRPAPLEDPDEPVCNAGRGKAAVNPYGDLLTCLEVREPVGNLREGTFHQLWRSPAAERVRGRRVRHLGFDASCGDGAFCDHCQGMAIAETGDPMRPVPFLMELARIRREVFEEDLQLSRGGEYK